MATVNDITNAAYLKCGLRSPTDAGDDVALVDLNNMIGIWSADFLVPHITRESFDLVIGQSTYTIGDDVSYDFNTIRPTSIVNVYLEDVAENSYTVKIMGPKEYNEIGQKAGIGRPTKVYYIPEFPAGKLIFDTETDIAYTVYFEFWKPIAEFAAKTTEVLMPPGFKEALVYNLAIRLAENNAIDLPQTVIALAAHSYNVISKLSAVNRQHPPVIFDFGNGPAFNIEKDE